MDFINNNHGLNVKEFYSLPMIGVQQKKKHLIVNFWIDHSHQDLHFRLE